MLEFSRLKTLVIFTVCLGFIWMALPNALSPEQRDAFPEDALGRTVNLGLDLRGGSHLLLELDFDAYMAEQIENLRADLRAEFLKEKIGFMNLAAGTNSVSLTVRPETLGEKSLSSVLRKISPDLEFTEDDQHRIVVRLSDEALKRKKIDLLDQSIEIVNRRVNELGTTEPSIQRQGDNRILVQVPGLEDPRQLKNILGKTAKMTFHLVNTTVKDEQMLSGRMPLGTRLLPSDDPEDVQGDGTLRQYPVYAKVELSGEMLTNASVSYDKGRPVVAFTFDTAGARKFAEITRNNVGKPFAIVLDGKVITAPVIQTPILGGSGIITGNYTAATANDLAILLRAGALPAPLEVVEERTVGPSLGNDSIATGTYAALVGVALVMVFMVIFYGLFGLFADVALLVNLAMIVGALSLLQATLTLPGIAGIVLTLGMAVDTNVLVYERMREEVARGRTLFSAIEHGYRAAFGTIIDAHVTTLIAATVLFAFGTGTVKGFAVTLAIGLLASLFTALMLSRFMIVTWLRRARPKKLPL